MHFPYLIAFLPFLLALLVVIVSSPARAVPAQEEGFTSMFDGKTLEGWSGKPGGWWVEDGALTSESTEEKPCVKHHYLFWDGGQPGDFILRFEYRITGGNSGVQIRSEKRPDYDVWGYQADIDAEGQWTGCLFQHDRGAVVERGFKAVITEDGTRTDEPIADPKALLKLVKPDQWNTYEVTARGHAITLSINDNLMCTVEDRHATLARDNGHIALQMHPGPPMKVQFRNLRIKLLDQN
jgi:hypothetical protein